MIFTSLFPKWDTEKQKCQQKSDSQQIKRIHRVHCDLRHHKGGTSGNQYRISKISAPRSVFMPSNFFICFSAPYIFCLFYSVKESTVMVYPLSPFASILPFVSSIVTDFPSASVIVPLFVRLVNTLSPVTIHVESLSITRLA